MPERELKAFLKANEFTVANMSYRVSDDGAVFEYRMLIRTVNPENLPNLAVAWSQHGSVRSFRISPTGD